MNSSRLQAKGSVIAAFILLIGVNLWYYSGQLPDLDFSPPTPFAFVTHTSGEAFHRPQGQKYWQRLSLGQGLFESNELRTGASSLLLNLNGDSSLEVMPETILSVSHGKLSHSWLRLIRGQIRLRGEKERKLFVGPNEQSKFLYRYGEALFQAENKGLSVEVVSGKLVAQTRTDNHVLSRGDRGRLTATQFFVEESKILIVEPREKDQHTLPPNRHMKVRWQTLGPAYDRVVIFGGSSPGGLIALPHRNGQDPQEIFVPIRHEVLYWKLMAESSHKGVPKRESATFFTRFNQLSAPVALSPKAGFLPRGRYGETIIKFLVDNPGGLKNLTLELSPSPSFHYHVQREQLGRGKEASVKTGAVGNLYWRVVGQSPVNGELIESEPVHFAILDRHPSEMAWAAQAGLSVDWEVELESRNGKVTRHKLQDTFFILDPSKVPSDISAVKYRFSDVGVDILTQPWRSPDSGPVRLPVAQSGFYYLQMKGTDLEKKAKRLFRNDLIYFEVPARGLAASGRAD